MRTTTNNGHGNGERLLNMLKLQRQTMEVIQRESARRLNAIQEVRRVVRSGESNSIAKVAEIEKILDRLS